MWEYEGYDVPDRLYGEIDVPMCFGKYDKKDEDCFFCDVNNECKKEREKVKWETEQLSQQKTKKSAFIYIGTEH